MERIRITSGQVVVEAILNETPTAQANWQALPLEARASTWGDEIYFNIPVRLAEAEDALEVVNMGDLGYWSPGHAFCIFFGRTPMSLGNEIRPASAVNVFGRVDGDATVMKKVPDGARISVVKIIE
ncbi:MAG: cyclophilin-like fold protein [Anaerolineae bacterium]